MQPMQHRSQNTMPLLLQCKNLTPLKSSSKFIATSAEVEISPIFILFLFSSIPLKGYKNPKQVLDKFYCCARTPGLGIPDP